MESCVIEVKRDLVSRDAVTIRAQHLAHEIIIFLNGFIFSDEKSK